MMCVRGCDYPCVDCGITPWHILLDGVVYGEDYWVYDEVWEQAGMKADGGFLCVGCLESRLGRALTSDDFPDYDFLSRGDVITTSRGCYDSNSHTSTSRLRSRYCTSRSPQYLDSLRGLHVRDFLDLKS